MTIVAYVYVGKGRMVHLQILWTFRINNFPSLFADSDYGKSFLFVYIVIKVMSKCVSGDCQRRWRAASRGCRARGAGRARAASGAARTAPASRAPRSATASTTAATTPTSGIAVGIPTVPSYLNVHLTPYIYILNVIANFCYKT